MTPDQTDRLARVLKGERQASRLLCEKCREDRPASRYCAAQRCERHCWELCKPPCNHDDTPSHAATLAAQCERLDAEDAMVLIRWAAGELQRVAANTLHRDKVTADELSRIAAALESGTPPVSPGWQPIATAPVSERIRIIGAVPGFVVGDIFYGPASLLLSKMGDAEYVRERSEEAWRYTGSEDKLLSHQQPTHWQPLPSPPGTPPIEVYDRGDRDGTVQDIPPARKYPPVTARDSRPTVEEMCRALLTRATNDGLVFSRVPGIQGFSSGELTGMANLLSGYLRTRPDIADSLRAAGLCVPDPPKFRDHGGES